MFSLEVNVEGILWSNFNDASDFWIEVNGYYSYCFYFMSQFLDIFLLFLPRMYISLLFSNNCIAQAIWYESETSQIASAMHLFENNKEMYIRGQKHEENIEKLRHNIKTAGIVAFSYCYFLTSPPYNLLR